MVLLPANFTFARPAAPITHCDHWPVQRADEVSRLQSETTKQCMMKTRQTSHATLDVSIRKARNTYRAPRLST